MKRTPQELRNDWNSLVSINKTLRICDAAAQLGVSEAELLSTQCGETVTRLRPEWIALLPRIKELGYVMALTRNDNCVHERKGIYEDIRTGDNNALVLGEDIDLRLFPSTWKYVYAVREASSHGERKSIQIFDVHGGAVHKIYMTAQSDAEAYGNIVFEFMNHNQVQGETDVTLAPEPKADNPDSEIDVENFRAAWSALEDTHDFFPMLKRFNAGRLQALRLAGNEWAYPVKNNAARQILTDASETQTPIMVFVANRGAIQIHTGTVTKLLETGPWFNVLDEKFNLHLRQSAIRSSWIVKKPTTEGIVTSLEVFDNNGDMIVQFFGKRKPGIPELQEWRNILEKVSHSEVEVYA